MPEGIHVMPFPILLDAIWARPSTQILLACVLVFALAVGIGCLCWRQGFRHVAGVMLVFALPWGIALVLLALHQVGMYGPQ